MRMVPSVPCPRCGRKLQLIGPLQNDANDYKIKKDKRKCENCKPLGTVWEVTSEDELVIEIRFLRNLFRDFDHR